MSGRDGSVVEAQGDCGYTLRGRRVEYVSPALSRRCGDCARAAARVPGGSATGNDDCGDVGVVLESPACDDVIVVAIIGPAAAFPVRNFPMSIAM